MDKLQYIQNRPTAWASLPENATGSWGVMNARQMVEHVTDFFNLANGKVQLPVYTPVEDLPKYKAFLFSDKEFRENTKAPAQVLGDTPLPYRTASMETAIAALQQSIQGFTDYFAQHPSTILSHPVFGPLNFEEWVLLNYKHVLHHSKQFDAVY
jgi:hypothetical protein